MRGEGIADRELALDETDLEQVFLRIMQPPKAPTSAAGRGAHDDALERAAALGRETAAG